MQCGAVPFDSDKLLNVFVKHIQTRFKEDVALVLGYGSRFRGNHHPKSDLDIVFINDTPRGAQASIQFVMDDIGFDFFPVSWERAEGIVSFNEPLLSIILDGVVVYARSGTDVERLESLRQKARHLMSPEGRPAMLKRATEQFKECCVQLYSMRIAAEQNDLASSKIEAAKLIHNLVFVIFMLNQTYCRKSSVKEVGSLHIRPEGLAELLAVMMSQFDPHAVLEAGEQLADRTRSLLLEEIRKVALPGSYSEVCDGVYEEFKAYMDKARRACDATDESSAFFTCQLLQDQIARFVAEAETGVGWNRLLLHSDIRQPYQDAGLPDLMSAVSRSDFPAIREAVRQLDMNLKQRLEANGVRLNVFQNTDELERFLGSQHGAMEPRA